MPVLRIGKMVCRCPNAVCALCVRFSAYVCRQFPPHIARLLQTVAGARRRLNKLSGLFYHQATCSNRWRGHEVVLRVENDGACKHTGTPLPGIRVSVSNEVSVVNSQTVDDESNNFVGLTYPPSSRPTRLRVRRSESAAVPCQLWGMGCKGAIGSRALATLVGASTGRSTRVRCMLKKTGSTCRHHRAISTRNLARCRSIRRI